MIIGFDVDGVIAKAPFGLHKLLRYRKREWNFLLATPLGKILYNYLRRADSGMKEIICQLHDGGHRIVIATYALERYRSLVEAWLEKNKIPFNELILAKRGESASEFKVRAVLQKKCDYFVEDQLALVQAISRKATGVKVIHYVKKKDLGVLLSLREHPEKEEAPFIFCLNRSKVKAIWLSESISKNWQPVSSSPLPA